MGSVEDSCMVRALGSAVRGAVGDSDLIQVPVQQHRPVGQSYGKERQRRRKCNTRDLKLQAHRMKLERN